MKIGIMGGTFDPIHNGHLMLGKTAYEQFGLHEVWFMPNGNPPHKKQTSIESDAEHRLKMTSIAIENMAGFKVQDYEAKRESVSCSWETMKHFKEVYPEDEFFFIIGADSLFAIETWVHPERLFPNCVLLAAYRDDIDTQEEMNRQIDYICKKYHADIRILPSPLMNVSSSELRRRIENGKSITGFVPKKVENYIIEEGLYGA